MGSGRRLLAVLGAINWDTTLFVGTFAQPGEEVPVLKVERGPGGKGANVAVAAARILGPGKVGFVGALGDDATGGLLRESLRTEGVRTGGLVTVRGKSSGTAYMVVDETGSKAVHTHFGANEALGPDHLASPGVSGVLASAATLVVMDVPVSVAAAVAHGARGTGARLVYSPGVRAGEGGRGLDRMLGLAEDVVLDRNELFRLQGEREPKAGVRALLRRFPGLRVVATLGPSGCLVGAHGSISRVPPVRLEDLDLRAVNSTGSGDAFLAAYVCYTGLGRPPREAAMFGNLAGALKATSTLTRGSPSRTTLEEEMSRLGLRGRPRG